MRAAAGLPSPGAPILPDSHPSRTEQIWLGPAAQCGRGQDGELELVVLPPAEGALGQEPLPDPLQGQRLFPAGPAAVQRVGGQAEEGLAREGVVAGMQGRELAHELEDVSAAGQPSGTIRRAAAASWGVGSFLAGMPRP